MNYLQDEPLSEAETSISEPDYGINNSQVYSESFDEFLGEIFGGVFEVADEEIDIS